MKLRAAAAALLAALLVTAVAGAARPSHVYVPGDELHVSQATVDEANRIADEVYGK